MKPWVRFYLPFCHVLDIIYFWVSCPDETLAMWRVSLGQNFKLFFESDCVLAQLLHVKTTIILC